MERKINQSEWVDILKTMTFYNRTNGYINDVGGKLTFFDSNACIGGVDSFYITIEEVRLYAKNPR